MGAVKTRGRLTLSVSDLVCVYNEKDKSWQVSAWTEAELTAAEWVTDRQFLVADSLGCITMDSAEENQFMPVRGRKATKKTLNKISNNSKKNLQQKQKQQQQNLPTNKSTNSKIKN